MPVSTHNYQGHIERSDLRTKTNANGATSGERTMSSIVQSGARKPYVRILALNGGGARCWSALVILESLLQKVQTSDEEVLPCEYFHLIVGSEWGAIIAILLGRLRLSIPVCRDRLKKMGFPWGHVVWSSGPFFSSVMSQYYKCKFRKWVKEASPSRDGDLPLLEDNPAPGSALTMVLATDLSDRSTPRRFRSYTSGDDYQSNTIKIPAWKIMLAAIATPLDVNPVDFHGADGDLQYTCIASSLAAHCNPSWEALLEARRHFSPNSVDTIVNIGCGQDPDVPWSAGLRCIIPCFRALILSAFLISRVSNTLSTAAQMRAYKQMLHESANTTVTYQYLCASAVNKGYYNWSRCARQDTEKKTKAYLQSPEIVDQVEATANRLVRCSDIPVEYLETSRWHSALRPTRPWMSELRRTLTVVAEAKSIRPVRIALLDTGIDATHPWIHTTWESSRFYDFVNSAEPNECTASLDEAGHGTQMAGIILQMAPHVELYVLRVFQSNIFDAEVGNEALRRVEKAIKYATNELRVNIITMCFAFEGRQRDDLDAAITNAMSRNVIMLAAASNSGHRRENPYPASDRRVFRVNAVDDNGHSLPTNPPAGLDDNNDNLATFGADVLCPWPRNIPGGQETENKIGHWKQACGTSCATAIMTAVCALIMDYGRVLKRKDMHNPYLVDTLKTWEYLDRPQGMRQLFWKMARGRYFRTPDQFSYVCPWELVNPELEEAEIRKNYLDALLLAQDGMG